MNTDEPLFGPATGHPQHLHGGLDGRHYGLLGHDHSVDDDIFDAIASERVLLSESDETHSFPEVFGDHTGYEDVADYSLLCKDNAHLMLPPAGRSWGDCSPACSQAGAFRGATSSICDGLFSLSFSHSEGFANHFNQSATSSRAAFMSQNLIAPRGECLPQIAGQSSGYGIRQHQPIHDPMFFAMRDPGNKPYLTIDPFDIDADCKNVVDDIGLGQRRVAVVRHGSLQ